ncbi:hypothetical protein CCACVL1_20023 [Corchorus capsularis]|uniref:Uncharacterized protein n=1 Tax=Corchorus capsularis TaxID=210143 RepID=A0A1R3HD15_COCAP|nr:hypothetical protein CCACVL1_20023 [Corchorus capsularis]
MDQVAIDFVAAIMSRSPVFDMT